MRVAIIGATGLLGKYLTRAWTKDEVFGFGSQHLDIRDPEQVRNVITKTKPGWIVLAAAYTDVDGCEQNIKLAKETNFDGVVNVAEAACKSGSRVIFVSTDYVFDGAKTTPYDITDQRRPINAYGRFKAEAELAIQMLLPRACIVRTSWVFGNGGRCFPDTILKLAGRRNQLEIVNDQRGCPTYAADLALAIISLVRQDAAGIIHATNSGNCTWFEFASELARVAKLSIEIKPTATQNFPRPAKRPPYSVLSDASLRGYGIKMPTWQDGVERYLQERAAMGQ